MTSTHPMVGIGWRLMAAAAANEYARRKHRGEPWATPGYQPVGRDGSGAVHRDRIELRTMGANTRVYPGSARWWQLYDEMMGTNTRVYPGSARWWQLYDEMEDILRMERAYLKVYGSSRGMNYPVDVKIAARGCSCEVCEVYSELKRAA